MISALLLGRLVMMSVLAAAMSGLAAAAPVPKVYTVVVDKMAFGPTPTGLHVGDAIEWMNSDMFVHSATADDKSFDVDLKPKARVRMVLKKAGAFNFKCRYHPGMTGRLIVTK